MSKKCCSSKLNSFDCRQLLKSSCWHAVRHQQVWTKSEQLYIFKKMYLSKWHIFTVRVILTGELYAWKNCVCAVCIMLCIHCEISVSVLQKLLTRFNSKLNNWCHYFWLRYALWAYSCGDSVRLIKPGVYIITIGAVRYFLKQYFINQWINQLIDCK